MVRTNATRLFLLQACGLKQFFTFCVSLNSIPPNPKTPGSKVFIEHFHQGSTAFVLGTKYL